MKYLILLSVVLSSTPSMASIFGKDDRLDISQVKDQKILNIAKSIPAIVRKKHIKPLNETHYKIEGLSYIDDLNFCEDEKFVKKQTLVANCSAFLVGDDVVGTAAHCFSHGNEMRTEDYVVVFDYKADKFGNSPTEIAKENVFEIEKIIKQEFEWVTYKDYALIKLKRKTDRKPLPLNLGQRVEVGTPLFIVGYPLGLPQKYQPDGEVLSVDHKINSFRHHLDTYSVNSGSAIFNAETNEIVGIHVRGTGFNYVRDKEKNCNRWQVGDPKKDWGEANFIDIAL